MKTFINRAAQGDIYLTRIDTPLPPKATPVPPDDNNVIVGHSETGHHHVMDRATTTLYRLPEEIYEAFLVVTAPTELRHLRAHDTHETLLVPPGTYRVRHQREHTPEGWRRAAD